jgi:hypothetical protein
MAPNLKITSFIVSYGRLTVSEMDEKYVKLLITDSPTIAGYAPHIWFLDLDTENDFEPTFDSIEKVDYEEFVYNHKLFVNEETRLLKIKMAEVME